MYFENSEIEVGRPDRFTQDKDALYHVNYAMDILDNKIDMETMRRFYYRNLINKNFYAGNQWIFDEDLDGFLMDENGDARNRIKFVQNIIKPHVEYYRGSAVKMGFSATAVNVSPAAISRKNAILESIKFKQDFVDTEVPFAKKEASKRYGLADTEEQTEEIFSSTYVDKFAQNINSLMKKIASSNGFEEKKKNLALNIALSGIAIEFEEERTQEQIFTTIDPNTWFFDTNAKRQDLRDAEFQGHVDTYTLSSVLEEYQNLSEDEIDILSKVDNMYEGNFPHMIGNPMNSFVRGRIPVYKIYWADIEEKTIGCVIEDDMYCLRYIEKGGKYTKEDCVTPPDNFYEDLLGNEGKKKEKRNKFRKIYTDCTRFCHFVKGDFVGHSAGHFVLKFGKRKFTEKNSVKKEFLDLGYNSYCWSYLGNGEILSPIDDIIDINRYINRLNSMAEAQANNARGSGFIYDSDAVKDEEEFLRGVNAGKPVGVEARGQLNNKIIPYDNSLKQGTLTLHQMAKMMKEVASDMYGGQALLGGGDGVRVSVGAVQQNLNQATVMQEPFFFALTNTLLQCYQAMANRGKKIYSSTGEVLVDTIGNEGAELFQITEEFENEQFNIEIKRSTNELEDREAADGTLLSLYSNQLIDNETLSRYFGKCSLVQIGQVLREYTSKVIIAQREKARQQAMQAEGAAELASANERQASLDKERGYAEVQNKEEMNSMSRLQEKLIQNAAKMQNNAQ